jgi:Putative lumazine-binding
VAWIDVDDAIIATAMDYFEGWFDGDGERMARALHPELDKRGVNVDETVARLSDQMTATQMIGWTLDGEGKAERPADIAITVRVDGIHERIATATVYSALYVEYLHLMRTSQGWRIVNALFMRRSGQAA